jgi:hypothetical protein
MFDDALRTVGGPTIYFRILLNAPSVLNCRVRSFSSSSQLSQSRVVVENSIGRIKKWRILQRYRHYSFASDAEDRARLGQIVRVLAALINWRSKATDASGKRARGVNWTPATNKAYVEALLTEASKIGGAEEERLLALYGGETNLRKLGLEGAPLTEDDEALLQSKGDTTETWKEIGRGSGVVQLNEASGNIRSVHKNSRAAAST